MQSIRRVTALVVAASLTALGVGLAVPSQATNPPLQNQAGVPGDIPGASPNFLNGEVLAVAQVGDTMVIGGTFTSVANPGSSSGATQPFLVGYSLSTEQLIPGWNPVLDGPVNALVPAADGTSVYVGGQFKKIDGKTGKVAKVNAATGETDAVFRPPALNGAVSDLALSPGTTPAHLFVGGSFTSAGTQPRGGLASLDPSTGALDNYLTVSLTGHHNYGTVTGAAKGTTGAENIALNPAGDRLIVDGNFRTATDAVGPYPRDQILSIDLASTGTVDPNWNTSVYAPVCNKKFDSYVRDVAWSPDGTYFVVVATGGYVGTPPSGQHCDAAVRFEDSASGTNVQPTWTDRTGGDSLYSVTVTKDAVFVGGHPRWLNNDTGADRAKPGAVPRPGLGALDPRSGVPLSWNPGRNPRGGGAEVIYAGPSGVWVGSDTDWVGNFRYKKQKLAFFPWSTGTVNPADDLGNPSKIYIGGNSGNSFASRTFNSSTGTWSGSTTEPVGSGIAWSTVRGAFMLNGRLWFGMNGNLYVRDFNGSSFGTPLLVDPYGDPTWNGVPSGSDTQAGDPILYTGAKSGFYAQIPNVTAMFYSNGAIYYTLTGKSGLYKRGFSPDTRLSTSPNAPANTTLGGVVGALETTVASTGFPSVGGMFLSNGKLFFAASNGTLRSVPFVNGAPSGASTQVGTTTGWRGKAVFTAPF